MEHWFVYYKVPSGELDEALRRARARVARVAAVHPVRARVLRRGDAGDTETVMESYPDIADAAAFAQALEAALAAGDETPADRAARRLERFVDA